MKSTDALLSQTTFTDPQKAAWAIAHVQVEQRPRFNRALARAYRPCRLDLDGSLDERGVPDRAAVAEALAEAEGIVVTLKRALEMIG
jgi:hypothetical protein